eukprot:5326056-Pleurochrysis_carterae.AAC.1
MITVLVVREIAVCRMQEHGVVHRDEVRALRWGADDNQLLPRMWVQRGGGELEATPATWSKANVPNPTRVAQRIVHELWDSPKDAGKLQQV